METNNHQSTFENISFFARRLEDLIREIIVQNDIPYYRVEASVKHHPAGNGDGYYPLIRIITYFEDTVNKISHILHDEFDVDVERLVDKKKIRVETFAYKNINCRASLKPDRQKQTEYRRCGSRKFEIHICSMLQDAWSGIEQELGFDSAGIPDEDKRDLYRVGALLEMADIEFMKIRAELSRKLLDSIPAPAEPAHPVQTVPTERIVPKAATVHEPNVVPELPVMQEPAPAVQKSAAIAPDDNTPLTDETLRNYVKSSSVIKETDASIGEHSGAKINTDIDIEGDTERLGFLNIRTIGQLDDALRQNQHDVISFADKWIGKNNGGQFDAGICLFYLEYLLVAKNNDASFAVEYVTRFISDNDYSARYIIPTYQAVKNGVGSGHALRS